MDRLSILVGRLIKSMAPTKYFVKVPLVGRFMSLVGGFHRPVESPLDISTSSQGPFFQIKNDDVCDAIWVM